MKICKYCGFQWSSTDPEFNDMIWEDFCPSCNKFIKTYRKKKKLDKHQFFNTIDYWVNIEINNLPIVNPLKKRVVCTFIHNYTPHDIYIITEDKTINIKSEGVARCTTNREKVSYIGIIPIYKTSFGEVEGLPEPKENHVYIVSSLVAQACPERLDLLIPDDTVRDSQGKIIGCRGLARI